jgi:hypothetical protein
VGAITYLVGAMQFFVEQEDYKDRRELCIT